MRQGVQGEKVGKLISVAPRTANPAAPVLLQPVRFRFTTLRACLVVLTLHSVGRRPKGGA